MPVPFASRAGFYPVSAIPLDELGRPAWKQPGLVRDAKAKRESGDASPNSADGFMAEYEAELLKLRTRKVVQPLPLGTHKQSRPIAAHSQPMSAKTGLPLNEALSPVLKFVSPCTASDDVEEKKWVQRAIRAFALREGGEMNGRALGYNGHYGHPRLREAIRRAGGLRCALESAPGIEFVKGGTVRVL